MKLTLETTPIRDLVVVHHEYFEDKRGFFVEVFRQDIFAELGLPTGFVQVNHSKSCQNVVRGLHFQWDPPMGKLMRVLQGRAYLMAVDIRKGSPTLGQHFGIELSAEEHTQLWAPAGFARGFAVLSESAEIEYLCTGVYNHKGESGIRWNDPQVGINWPVETPIISDKDDKAQTLDEWLARPESDHFSWKPTGR